MSLRMKVISVEKMEIDLDGIKDLKTVLGELEAAGIDLTDFKITQFNDDRKVLSLTKQTRREISKVDFRNMQLRAKRGLDLNADVFEVAGIPDTPTLGYLRGMR